MPKLEIGNHSDPGRVRKINEDYFGSFKGDYGNLLIVCDGMGGHQGGEIASRLAVDSIKNHFEILSGAFVPQDELRKCLIETNKKIIEAAGGDSSLSDMGSTAVVALIIGNELYTANLGDSRIYIVSNEGIVQLTKDHSLVQQMIDSKMITAEHAKDHPQKNVITKSLGIQNDPEPDITEPIELAGNEILILCSDGLTNYVSDEEILKTVNESSAQDAANRLVEMANARGGGDNITVQVVKVLSKGKDERNKLKKVIVSTAFSFILLLILAGIFLFDIFDFNKEQNPVVTDSVKTAIPRDQISNPIEDTLKTQNNNDNPDSLLIGS